MRPAASHFKLGMDTVQLSNPEAIISHFILVGLEQVKQKAHEDALFLVW
jgi:hypothetical protein